MLYHVIMTLVPTDSDGADISLDTVEMPYYRGDSLAQAIAAMAQAATTHTESRWSRVSSIRMDVIPENQPPWEG